MASEDEVVRYSREMRRSINQLTDRETQALIAAYTDAMFDIEARVAKEANRRLETYGEAVFDQEAVLALEVSRELDALAPQWSAAVEDAMNQHVQLAIQSGQRQVELEAARAKVQIGGLNRDAVHEMAGRATERRPISQMFTGHNEAFSQQLGHKLLTGQVLGRNPKEVARSLHKTFGEVSGGTLARFVTIARTEMNDASRRGLTVLYKRHSNVLKGKERMCTLDERTCLACIALDGTIYPLDAQEDDHQNGRCTWLPVIKDFPGVKVRQRRVGRDWFKKLPEATKRRMLGAKAYRGYKDGQFNIDDFATLRDNPGWRPAFYQSTYEQALRNHDLREDIFRRLSGASRAALGSAAAIATGSLAVNAGYAFRQAQKVARMLDNADLEWDDSQIGKLIKDQVLKPQLQKKPENLMQRFLGRTAGQVQRNLPPFRNRRQLDEVADRFDRGLDEAVRRTIQNAQRRAGVRPGDEDWMSGVLSEIPDDFLPSAFEFPRTREELEAIIRGQIEDRFVRSQPLEIVAPLKMKELVAAPPIADEWTPWGAWAPRLRKASTVNPGEGYFAQVTRDIGVQGGGTDPVTGGALRRIDQITEIKPNEELIRATWERTAPAFDPVTNERVGTMVSYVTDFNGYETNATVNIRIMFTDEIVDVDLVQFDRNWYAHVQEMANRGQAGWRQAGTSTRSIYAAPSSGRPFVYHNSQYLEEWAQGYGWATQYNNWAFAFYVTHGIDEVQVQTATMGSYTWAQQGFEFENPGEAMRIISNRASLIQVMVREGLITEQQLSKYLNLVISYHEQHGGMTAFELSQLGKEDAWEIDRPAGYRDGRQVERKRMSWFGKEVMIGTGWRGRMKLGPGAVGRDPGPVLRDTALFPRYPRFLTADAVGRVAAPIEPVVRAFLVRMLAAGGMGIPMQIVRSAQTGRVDDVLLAVDREEVQAVALQVDRLLERIRNQLLENPGRMTVLQAIMNVVNEDRRLEGLDLIAWMQELSRNLPGEPRLSVDVPVQAPQIQGTTETDSLTAAATRAANAILGIDPLIEETVDLIYAPSPRRVVLPEPDPERIRFTWPSPPAYAPYDERSARRIYDIYIDDPDFAADSAPSQMALDELMQETWSTYQRGGIHQLPTEVLDALAILINDGRVSDREWDEFITVLRREFHSANGQFSVALSETLIEVDWDTDNNRDPAQLVVDLAEEHPVLVQFQQMTELERLSPYAEEEEPFNFRPRIGQIANEIWSVIEETMPTIMENPGRSTFLRSRVTTRMRDWMDEGVDVGAADFLRRLFIQLQREVEEVAGEEGLGLGQAMLEFLGQRVATQVYRNVRRMQSGELDWDHRQIARQAASAEPATPPVPAPMRETTEADFMVVQSSLLNHMQNELMFPAINRWYTNTNSFILDFIEPMFEDWSNFGMVGPFRAFIESLGEGFQDRIVEYLTFAHDGQVVLGNVVEEVEPRYFAETLRLMAPRIQRWLVSQFERLEREPGLPPGQEPARLARMEEDPNEAGWRRIKDLFYRTFGLNEGDPDDYEVWQNFRQTFEVAGSSNVGVWRMSLEAVFQARHSYTDRVTGELIEPINYPVGIEPLSEMTAIWISNNRIRERVEMHIRGAVGDLVNQFNDVMADGEDIDEIDLTPMMEHTAVSQVTENYPDIEAMTAALADYVDGIGVYDDDVGDPFFVGWQHELASLVEGLREVAPPQRPLDTPTDARGPTEQEAVTNLAATFAATVGPGSSLNDMLSVYEDWLSGRHLDMWPATVADEIDQNLRIIQEHSGEIMDTGWQLLDRVQQAITQAFRENDFENENNLDLDLWRIDALEDLQGRLEVAGLLQDESVTALGIDEITEEDLDEDERELDRIVAEETRLEEGLTRARARIGSQLLEMIRTTTSELQPDMQPSEVSEFIIEVAAIIGQREWNVFHMTWERWATVLDIAATRVLGTGPADQTAFYRAEWFWTIASRALPLARWYVPELEYGDLDSAIRHNNPHSQSLVFEAMAAWIGDFGDYLREAMMIATDRHLTALVSWEPLTWPLVGSDYHEIVLLARQEIQRRGITDPNQAVLAMRAQYERAMLLLWQDAHGATPSVLHPVVNARDMVGRAVEVWLSTQGWPAPIQMPEVEPAPEPGPELSQAERMQIEAWEQFLSDWQQRILQIRAPEPENVRDALDQAVREQILINGFLHLRGAVESAVERVHMQTEQEMEFEDITRENDPQGAALYADFLTGLNDLWQMFRIWEYRNDDFPVEINVRVEAAENGQPAPIGDDNGEFVVEARENTLQGLNGLEWELVRWGLDDTVDVRMQVMDVVLMFQNLREGIESEGLRFRLNVNNDPNFMLDYIRVHEPPQGDVDPEVLEDFLLDRAEEMNGLPMVVDSDGTYWRVVHADSREARLELEGGSGDMLSVSPEEFAANYQVVNPNDVEVLEGQIWANIPPGDPTQRWRVTSVNAGLVTLQSLQDPEDYLTGRTLQWVNQNMDYVETPVSAPPTPQVTAPTSGALQFTGTAVSWERLMEQAFTHALDSIGWGSTGDMGASDFAMGLRMHVSPMEPEDAEFRQGILNDLRDRIREAYIDTFSDHLDDTMANTIVDGLPLLDHMNTLVNTTADFIEERLRESSTGIRWASYVRMMRNFLLEWISNSDFEYQGERPPGLTRNPHFTIWLRDAFAVRGGGIFDIAESERNMGSLMVFLMNMTALEYRAWYMEFVDLMEEGGIPDETGLQEVISTLQDMTYQALFAWRTDQQWTPGQPPPFVAPQAPDLDAVPDSDLRYLYTEWQTEGGAIWDAVKVLVRGWIDEYIDEANSEGRRINDDWEDYGEEDARSIVEAIMQAWPDMSLMVETTFEVVEENLLGVMVTGTDQQSLLDQINEIIDRWAADHHQAAQQTIAAATPVRSRIDRIQEGRVRSLEEMDAETTRPMENNPEVRLYFAQEFRRVLTERWTQTEGQEAINSFTTGVIRQVSTAYITQEMVQLWIETVNGALGLRFGRAPWNQRDINGMVVRIFRGVRDAFGQPPAAGVEPPPPPLPISPPPVMSIQDVRAAGEFLAERTPGSTSSDIINSVGPQMLGKTWDRVALSMRGGTVLGDMDPDLRVDLLNWLVDNRPLRLPPEPTVEPDPDILTSATLRETAGQDLLGELNYLIRRYGESPERLAVYKRYLEARLAGDTVTAAVANITPDLVGDSYYDLSLSAQQAQVTAITNDVMAAAFGGARYGAASQQRSLEEVARELQAQGVDPTTVGGVGRNLSAEDEERNQEAFLLREAIRDDLASGRPPRMADLRELGKLLNQTPMQVLRDILEEKQALFDAGHMREYLADQVGAGFNIAADNIYAQWLADILGWSMQQVIEQAQQDFIQRSDEGPGTPHAWRPEEGPPRAGWWITIDIAGPTDATVGQIIGILNNQQLLRVAWLNGTETTIRSSDRFFRVRAERMSTELYNNTVFDPMGPSVGGDELAVIPVGDSTYIVLDEFGHEDDFDVPDDLVGLEEAIEQEEFIAELEEETERLMAVVRGRAEELVRQGWILVEYVTAALSAVMIDPQNRAWLITEEPDEDEPWDLEDSVESVGEAVSQNLQEAAQTQEAMMELLRGLMGLAVRYQAVYVGAIQLVFRRRGIPFHDDNQADPPEDDLLEWLAGSYGAEIEDGDEFETMDDLHRGLIDFTWANLRDYQEAYGGSRADDELRAIAEEIVFQFRVLTEGL